MSDLFRSEAVAHAMRRLDREVVLASPLPTRVMSLLLVGVLVLADLNDRFGRGSIYPGWLVHGLGNVTTQYALTFLR